MTVAFPVDKLPQGHSRGANQSGKGRSLSSQTLGEVESPLHRYLAKHPRDDDVFWCPSGGQKQSNWINWMKCCVSIEGEIQADRRGKSKSGKKPKTMNFKNGWTSWWPKPAPQVEVFITSIGPNLAACKQFWQVDSKARNGMEWPVHESQFRRMFESQPRAICSYHPWPLPILFWLPRCSQCLAFAHLPALELGPRLGPDFTTLTWDIHQPNSLWNFHRSEKGGGWRMTTANRSAYQCTETINLPRSQLQTLTLTAYNKWLQT